jgi:hypothetical protein
LEDTKAREALLEPVKFSITCEYPAYTPVVAPVIYRLFMEALLLNTTLPVPVAEVTPVPPLAGARTPETADPKARLVALVKLIEAGVPR